MINSNQKLSKIRHPYRRLQPTNNTRRVVCQLQLRMRQRKKKNRHTRVGFCCHFIFFSPVLNKPSPGSSIPEPSPQLWWVLSSVSHFPVPVFFLRSLFRWFQSTENLHHNRCIPLLVGKLRTAIQVGACWFFKARHNAKNGDFLFRCRSVCIGSSQLFNDVNYGEQFFHALGGK